MAINQLELKQIKIRPAIHNDLIDLKKATGKSVRSMAEKALMNFIMQEKTKLEEE